MYSLENIGNAAKAQTLCSPDELEVTHSYLKKTS